MSKGSRTEGLLDLDIIVYKAGISIMLGGKGGRQGKLSERRVRVCTRSLKKQCR